MSGEQATGGAQRHQADLPDDGRSPSAAGRRFGATELPPQMQRVVKKAIVLEWVTLGVMALTITAVGIVMGSSQAMRAAWIEDLLSLIPPIAFLVAIRVINRPPSRNRPYGNHRAVGVGHLVASVALLVMGALLVVDSALGLITGEHPPIGTFHLFGQTVWQGWFMIGIMLLSVPGPVILGRMKLKLAEQLHDKVLYADADMNTADWQTGLATAVGVAGVGLGLWWFDAAAALFVGASILKDGLSNVATAITDLADSRARELEGTGPHPLISELEHCAQTTDWVEQAGARVRDEGHVFHVELFVVPRSAGGTAGGAGTGSHAAGARPAPVPVDVRALEELRGRIVDLDWKLEDVVVVPVTELPQEVRPSPDN
ncbi:Divalent metal cation (Fe/Co/Zn/Cd) transporter [Micrococcus terreus]|uniref:Divalent metal cation (Fe/Co/Zn/Cd) transporter n=2 Tax=Micrococcus terreus TaxID=574650 RepID=A0A1I7ME31_9MICC|nr:Divalent metal cation (Fe/Co/Zn/Cd) transporter [Micrococcus terreus]